MMSALCREPGVLVALALLVLVVVAPAVASWLLELQQRATEVVFVDAYGREVMDVTLRMGQPARQIKAVPKQGTVVDATLDSIEHGYDTAESGAKTAADGSSTFEAEGLILTLSPLAPSPKDEAGLPIFSEIETKVDGLAGPGEIHARGRLRVAVVAQDEVVADHVDFEEIPAA